MRRTRRLRRPIALVSLILPALALAGCPDGSGGGALGSSEPPTYGWQGGPPRTLAEWTGELQSEDPAVRRQALGALRAWGHADGDAGGDALEAAVPGHEAAREALANALDSPWPDVQAGATEFAARPQLIQLLDATRDPSVVAAAAFRLGWLNAEASPEEIAGAVTALAGHLQRLDPTDPTQHEALSSVLFAASRFGASEPIVRRALELVDHPRLGSGALDVLPHATGPLREEALVTLVRVCQDPKQSDRRLAALAGLSDLDPSDPRAVSMFVACLSGPERDAQFARVAVRGLARARHPAAAAPLLAELGQEYRPRSLARNDEEQFHTERARTAALLGGMGSAAREALPGLAKLLEAERNPVVREAIERAIQEIERGS